MTLGLLALLSLALFVGVPFLVTRGLAVIRMPLAVRLAIIASFPLLLVWWLGSDSEFRDIANPGAAVIPLLMMLGWLTGAGWPCLTRRARLACADAPSDQFLRDQRFRIGRWR